MANVRYIALPGTSGADVLTGEILYNSAFDTYAIENEIDGLDGDDILTALVGNDGTLLAGVMYS